MSEQVTRAMCRWCHSMCRVAVHTKDGELVKIEEDQTDPRVNMIFPPTRACVRLAGAKEFIYHPDRLKFPLKRKGERGENKWETISWAQAVSEIAAKLAEIVKKFGPESVATTTGTGRTDLWVWQRFMNVLGSPNLGGQGTI
ncbi:MAG: molybdopterin-dependent oxidoreductase [Chloroflexi bacterium]|nr:molybdopterin-dependent oxidoreductase [Chloroflexota bacterium]